MGRLLCVKRWQGNAWPVINSVQGTVEEEIWKWMGGGRLILWLCSASHSASSVSRPFSPASYWSWWFYRDFHTFGSRAGFCEFVFGSLPRFAPLLPPSPPARHTQTRWARPASFFSPHSLTPFSPVVCVLRNSMFAGLEFPLEEVWLDHGYFLSKLGAGFLQCITYMT